MWELIERLRTREAGTAVISVAVAAAALLLTAWTLLVPHPYAVPAAMLTAAALAAVLAAVGWRMIGELRSEAELARRLLIRQSRSDELTGLRNRGGFFEFGRLELLRSRRLGRPASVALLKIDNFERVHGGYGLDAADRVLKELARMLRAAFRDYDIGGRFSPDEFIIMLPETDHRTAATVIARFLDAARSHRFELGSGRTFLTFSGGLVTYSGRNCADEDLTGLVQRAIQGARRAAEQGGNRCCVGPAAEPAEPPPGARLLATS